MNILDGWEIRDLDDLVFIDQKKLGENTQRKYLFYYIDISSVSEGKFAFPEYKITFAEAPSRARKIINRGDVLMSTVRPNLKAFVYFNHSDQDCVASTGFAILTPKDQVDSRFIFQAILSDDVSNQIEAHVVGSNYPAINTNAVRRLKILVPPFPEQAKIAEILSTVDWAIEETEALIAKQQRIKTGLMQDLLTRGIDEHGNLRSEQTHQFKDSPLGRIPVEWKIRHLDWLAPEVIDCPHTTPNFLPGGILVARTFNLKDGRFVGEQSYVSETEYNTRITRLEPQHGDVIFTREAPVGEAFIIPSNLQICLGQRTMLIRCNVERCLSEYLLEVVYSEEMRIRFDQMVGGTTNPHLNVGDVRSLIIRQPCIEEQKLIAERIGNIRQGIEHNDQQLAKLRFLKTALMQDLLTGKKRVTALLEQAREDSRGGAENAEGRMWR